MQETISKRAFWAAPGRLAWAIFLLLGAVLCVGEETGGGRGVSLDALVQQALQSNPELRVYETEVEAARGVRRATALPASPEVSGRVGQKRASDDVEEKAGKGAAWSVSIMQTLEFPGRMALRKAIADRDVELAGLGLAQFRLCLEKRVRLLAFRIQAARLKAAAVREVTDRCDELSRVHSQRAQAGVQGLLEARILEATAVSVRRQDTEAALAAQSALMELNLLRNQPALSSLKIEAVCPDFAAVPEPGEFLASARTNSFEVRIRQAELLQQEKRVSLSRHERLPSITVGPFFESEEANDREQIAGLAVSLPFPFWDPSSGNVQTAEARRLRSAIALSMARQRVEKEVLEQTAAYHSRLAERAARAPDLAARLQEAAELADRQYRQGAIPVSLYLEMQKQYLEGVDACLQTDLETLETAHRLETLSHPSFSLVKWTQKTAK